MTKEEKLQSDIAILQEAAKIIMDRTDGKGGWYSVARDIERLSYSIENSKEEMQGNAAN